MRNELYASECSSPTPLTAPTTWQWLTRAAAGLLLLLIGSCTPMTMAYPVRIHMGPTPEPLGRGRGATQGSVGMIVPGDLWAPLAVAGGLRQHLGLTRWLELDADATAGNAEQRNLVVMGSLGLRFFPVRHSVFKLSLSVGGAMGCGGMKATGEDEDSYRAGCDRGSPGRLAGGGYAGFGLGVRVSWLFALYAAFRYQLTGARELPLTHWIQYGLGIQLDFPKNQRVFITLEGGGAYFINHLNATLSGYSMVGIGFRYRLWK